MTSVHAALRARFAPPEWSCLFEVRSAAGFDATRTADAVAMNMWPARGLEVHGVEVKVSRSDWLRELKDPQKSAAIQRYCDRWWVAVSDATIVKDGELPPTWGLLVLRGEKLVQKVEAPKLDAAPLSRTFVAALLRRAVESTVDTIPRAELRTRVAAEVKDQVAAHRDSYRRELQVVAPTVFRTVVADCPWAPRDALPGPKRGASKHYNTMPTADLRALSHRFPAIADDALLFSWRLASMPFDGLDVCRAWGFEPVSEIVWVKIPNDPVGRLGRRIARLFIDSIAAGPETDIVSFAPTLLAEAQRVRIMLGHYVRCCHETCIIAARPGAAARIKAHNIPSVFFAPVGAHSAKPDAFYELVERLAPGPYLELFARTPRGTSWTAIGDALGMTLDLPLAPSRSA